MLRDKVTENICFSDIHPYGVEKSEKDALNCTKNSVGYNECPKTVNVGFFVCLLDICVFHLMGNDKIQIFKKMHSSKKIQISLVQINPMSI